MTEKGFVPPIARKKLQMREKYRMKGMQNNRLILAVLCFPVSGFIVFNILYLRAIGRRGQSSDLESSSLDHSNVRGGSKPWISEDSQPFNEGQLASQANHLIIVAGHSVTVSGHLEDAGEDESDWFLLDYQKGQGLPAAIRGHIQAGIDEANRDPKSLLVFSGGETRAITGPLTEGSSYFHVADAMKMWPLGGTVRARTVTEEFATDSFENFMFSICRFKEVTGHYPNQISIVSFTFKERRFTTLHAPALAWPKEKLNYIGVDPPASTGFDLKRSTEGEWKNAAAPFESDPYGCSSKILVQKREGRNPFFRTAPYTLSCPDMRELLHYCGPDLFPQSRVPWE